MTRAHTSFFNEDRDMLVAALIGIANSLGSVELIQDNVSTLLTYGYECLQILTSYCVPRALATWL